MSLTELKSKWQQGHVLSAGCSREPICLPFPLHSLSSQPAPLIMSIIHLVFQARNPRVLASLCASLPTSCEPPRPGESTSLISPHIGLFSPSPLPQLLKRLLLCLSNNLALQPILSAIAQVLSVKWKCHQVPPGLNCTSLAHLCPQDKILPASETFQAFHDLTPSLLLLPLPLCSSASHVDFYFSYISYPPLCLYATAGVSYFQTRNEWRRWGVHTPTVASWKEQDIQGQHG